MVATIQEPISLYSNNGVMLQDTVIEVDIQHIGGNSINATGVICRVQPDNGGYRLWYGGDGLYNIALWQASERIKLIETPVPIKNLPEASRLTAVCVGDHIAMYINGALVAEVRNSTLTEGSTGIFASIPDEGAAFEARFDNLNIWTATSP